MFQSKTHDQRKPYLCNLRRARGMRKRHVEGFERREKLANVWWSGAQIAVGKFVYLSAAQYLPYVSSLSQINDILFTCRSRAD